MQCHMEAKVSLLVVLFMSIRALLRTSNIRFFHLEAARF